MRPGKDGEIINIKLLSTAFLALVYVSFSRTTLAVEIIPRLELSESYNDNVSLAQAGKEEEDYISQLNPGINVKGETKKNLFDFDYRMQNVFYKNHPDNNDTYHQASLATKSQIISDKLYLDADGAYTQQNVNVTDSVSFDNLSVDKRNKSNVTTYKISPYYIQKISDFAVARIQYTNRGKDYEKNTATVLDSETNTMRYDLSSGSLFHKFIWKLYHTRETTKYQNQPEILFRDSAAELRYILSPKTYLLGVRGYEENKYPYTGSGDTSGAYWKAGLGWSPTKRTKLELTKGQRYYGDTYSFSMSHEKKNSFWNILYKEDLTTTAKFEPQVVDESGLFTVELVPSSEVFVSKELYFNVNLKSRRSSLFINAFRFHREYQTTNEEEKNHGAVVKLRLKTSTNTHLNISEKWLYNTFRGATRKDNVYEHNLGLEYQFEKSTSAEIRYGHLRRKSNESQYDYKRNLVTLSVKFFF